MLKTYTYMLKTYTYMLNAALMRAGDVYDGMFRYGLQHGLGTHTSANGEAYAGADPEP